jgi:hypothetical protein
MMGWPSRRNMPESVRDLEREYVVKTLTACNVNITAAARKLDVPSADLRRLLYAAPELLSLAVEKEERRLDQAEDILQRELDSDDPRYSAAAAFFVLRNAKRASERGWRQPDAPVSASVTVDAAARRVTFRWRTADDDRLAAEQAEQAELIEHDPAEAKAAVRCEGAQDAECD